MKLVISIINRDDRDVLRQALVEAGYQATIVGTTGGFLREGNATFLIGVDDESVPGVLDVLRENCRTRTRTVVPMPPISEMGPLVAEPIEVEIGGAVVFVMSVDSFERY